MSFAIDPALDELRLRVRTFVDDHILPAEETILAEDQATGSSQTLLDLQAKARNAGLWTPHLPEAYGGLGLGVMGMCALFREMGRSLVGARVFNCDAPDQGNMDLLLKTASQPMKDKWLAPLCAGEITSAFCMTEPAPGAGSDPTNLRTKAVRDGDDWVIDGHKWFSTGGGAASFMIVMARTSDDRRTGCTMFLVDRHADGIEHVRDVPVMGGAVLQHREAEFLFRGVRVSNDAVLLGEGRGFELAQRRLVPARLTHCMRWLGWSERALDMCRAYVNERVSFGKPLAKHQAVQAMIARNALGIHQGNLMTLHCATLLEAGAGLEAKAYSSMAKLHCAKLLCQLLDDAIQMHGALGYSEDLPFSKWYRFARSARIADGPDEVHQMVIAREFLRGRLNVLV